MNKKPNFQVMNRKELQTYVLNHRDDDEAFYAYVDKVNAEQDRVTYQPVDSVEELERSPAYESLQKAALREEVLQLCKGAVGFDGITSCVEAPPESSKPWVIQRYGKEIYLTLEEAREYLKSL